MRNKLMFTSLALLFGVALVAAACSSDDKADSTTTTTEKATTSSTPDTLVNLNIVEIASDTEDFSTLVELVTAAKLAETLSGTGPFTVMAPTNEAFAKVPAATVDQLKADPSGALTDVLKLHVISGKVDSKALAADAGTCVETLGGKVKVEKSGDDLTFGGATVEKIDIEGSNGIIHAIDGVVTAASTDC